MDKILTNDEINRFKNDGAIFLKDKFDVQWISSLLALDATELVSQLLTAVEMINIHVISVLQKR